MIITRTPLRVSFFGGGTDFREYYAKHEGTVVSLTINKYVHVIIKTNHVDKYITITCFNNEKVACVDDLKHGIIREALKIAQVKDSVEIIIFTDISLNGTGLGSSSALAVGLLNALFAYKGKKIDPFELAELASHIEIDLLGAPIGKQDQYAVAFGGLREYIFRKDEKVTVREIDLGDEGRKILGEHIALFHTGIERKASDVLYDQKSRISQSEEHLHELKRIATESSDCFAKLNINKIGQLLSLNWESKKKLSEKIQNTVIEEMYNLGMQEGVYGGKLLGAGGGGYFCFLCPPEQKCGLVYRLRDYRELPISLDTQGSRLVSLQDVSL